MLRFLLLALIMVTLPSHDLLSRPDPIRGDCLLDYIPIIPSAVIGRSPAYRIGVIYEHEYAQSLAGSALATIPNNSHAQMGELVDASDMQMQAEVATAIVRAIHRGQEDELPRLLSDNGLDTNTTIDNVGNTVMHIATEEGNIPLLKALIARENAQLNVKNRLGLTPLDAAIFAEQLDMVLYLREEGAVRGGRRGFIATSQRWRTTENKHPCP